MQRVVKIIKIIIKAIYNFEMHNHAIIFFCNLFQQLTLSYFAITLT